MKTVTREDWVKALRSGEYNQGTGQLRYKDIHGTYHHCCLGVACTIAELPLKEGSQSWSMADYDVKYSNEWYIPPTVGEMLGLSPEDQLECVRMNDRQRMTFKQIADVIESGKIVAPVRHAT